MADARRIMATRVALLSLALISLAGALLVVGLTGRGAGPATRSPRGPTGAAKVSAGGGHSSAGGIGGPQRRQVLDVSGFTAIQTNAPAWKPEDSLQEIARAWDRPGMRLLPLFERELESYRGTGDPSATLAILIVKATLWNAEGRPDRAYQELEAARAIAESDAAVRSRWLSTIIYAQGVTSLRRGENDNCIDCRGEGSCILPIAPTAVHIKPTGSRLAIRHFTELLEAFPDDLEVRWLLNLAHMTLGEHPAQVDPRHLIALDRFRDSESDIGRFRDVGHLVGVNRFNQAGAGILEDFDGDGRLDLVVSSFDPTEPMALYRNAGDGTFQDRSAAAGVTDQLGGMFCVQADYNNDGRMDVFVARGAWLPVAMRPSLLRNDGGGRFTDVTRAAGLLNPVNSISAAWGDYDNDGHLDLFVCCELQPNRLYRNRGDGTFEEVAARAGLHCESVTRRANCCKGATWIDYDNDDYPDLFLDFLHGSSALFHNNRDGTFGDATESMGVDGPREGFSCWAWDYDNDGWLDVFATCYDRTLADVVRGLIGQPHRRVSNRLFHNRGGRSFEDVTEAAGLDQVFETMGSNFADFDNDGFLDMYLGTGEPNIATLIPNRMFKNVDGRRFAEVTGRSGTGHLQKGHGISCGDWDRDGDVDLFVQTGGVVNGDKYHNVLFQNPGQGNRWLSLKLVGKTTNRAAVGARIKVVTAGDRPQTIHRLVSSGSSFGANPLEPLIGLGRAEKVAVLEVHWPTSRTTQVFRDIAPDQAIEIVEHVEGYRKRDYRPIALPASE
jgi:FG-GAP-like repeat/ASPIC and UnbV